MLPGSVRILIPAVALFVIGVVWFGRSGQPPAAEPDSTFVKPRSRQDSSDSSDESARMRRRRERRARSSDDDMEGAPQVAMPRRRSDRVHSNSAGARAAREQAAADRNPEASGLAEENPQPNRARGQGAAGQEQAAKI